MRKNIHKQKLQAIMDFKYKPYYYNLFPIISFTIKNIAYINL